MSDLADTRRYFDALFLRKPRELSVNVWSIKRPEEKRGKRSLYAVTVGGAVGEAEAKRVDCDVYAGVGFAPRGASQTIGPYRRLSKTNVAGIAGLWCDLDVNGGPEGKTGAAPDRDAALELVRRAPLPPSMMVDSGYGIQCYWLFDEPWIFGTPEERQGAGELAWKWQEKLRRIAGELHPDFGMDSVADVSRVLRVPGTFNLKGGLRAPVRLIELDEDVRYDPQAFEQHVANVQLSLTGSHAANGAAIADDIVIDLRCDADPPFEKFDALKDVDDLFASAWSRDRADDPATRNWTASSWDMALVDRLVRARWTNQEMTDTLVAHRRLHKCDLKRPDYYVRTIARARATIEEDAVDQQRVEAIEELIAPPVTVEDSDPSHILGLFEKVVGVPLLSFVQFGRDPDEGGVFELQLAGKFAGQSVRIGDAETLLNPLKVRARVMTVTGILPPAVKRDTWDKVIERLMRVRVLHESDGEDAVGVLSQWLRSYLAATLSADRKEALQHGYPHIHEGRLFLSRDHLQTFVKTRFGERVQRRDLQAALRAAGFQNGAVSYRKDDGSPGTVSMYSRTTDERDTA